MSSNNEELVLRISGDSAQGQRAVQEMVSALNGLSGTTKDLSGATHEAGETSSFFGGILNEVFGSFPAKVAEGVLLRDAIHEIIAKIKEGAVEFGIMGSEIHDVHEGFDRLAGGTKNATDILDAMRQGVVGTINDFTLMTDANKLLATGALTNAKDFGTLTEASRVLSHEGFGPTKDLIEGLSSALETGRTKRLALMGVTVDAKGEETKYAASLGLTRDELTTSGKLHADRAAVMKALSGVVASAGEQETNLAEKIFASRVAIENWTHSLAEAIAVSPSVNRAFDSIAAALVHAFGGDAQDMLGTVLGWVNRLADGVATYGPPIIQALVDTKDKIVEIWHTVERAWDLVPDWFKNIARDAGMAGAAVFVVSEAMGAIGGPDILGTLANVAQIWSVIGVNVGKASTAIKEWTLLLAAFKWEAVTLAFGSISATIAAIAATPAGIAALIAALAAALWETGKAFKALFDTIEQGKSVWEFLTARDDDNFVRRWLGLSTGVKNVTTELSNQRPELEALMKSHGEATKGLHGHAVAADEAAGGVHKLTEEEKKLQEAMQDIASAGEGWVATLHRMDPLTVAGSVHFLGMGVSLEKVKTQFGLTETQAQAVKHQFDFLTKSTDDTNKAFDLHNRILGQLAPRYSAAHEFITGLTNDQKALSAEVLDFGLFKAPETIDAIGRWDNSTEGLRAHLKALRDDAHDALGDIATLFIQMGQAAGGSMSAIVGGIGQVMVALNALQHSGQKQDAQGVWVEMSPDEKSASTKQKALAGVVGGIGLGMNADTTQGFNHSMITGLGMDSAGGVAQTVALGIATMGISVGVQAAVAALKYLFRDRTLEDIARDAGREFGTNFSDETTKSIEKYIKGGFTFPAAELINLSKIIKDAGGLTDKNLPQMTARLHDVFSMIETHQFTIAQGAAVIDDNWQAFVAAGTDGNGRLSQSLKDIITLNERFGTQSKAIADYLQGQGKNAIAGFSAVMKASGLAANATKEDLADLGVQAVTTFAAAVAAGVPMAEALKQIAPALKTLRENYERLGLDVEDVALKNLLMQSTIVEGNPALMDAIGGLNQEMIALDNMGLLNVDTFAAMERTGLRMYTRLQAATAAAGGTTKDALIPMQGWLHQAAEEAEKLGIPLDDNTQSMIAQSKELGIWKDKGKDATQQLTDGVLTLNETMKQFLDYLGKIGPVPAPWANWGTPPQAPTPPGGAPGDEPPIPMASGGLFHVTRPTLFLAHANEQAAFSGVGKRFAGMGGLVVNVNVEGSIRSDRDLVDLIKQGLYREYEQRGRLIPAAGR